MGTNERVKHTASSGGLFDDQMMVLTPVVFSPRLGQLQSGEVLNGSRKGERLPCSIYQGSSGVMTRALGKGVFRISRIRSGRVGRFSNSHRSCRATLTRLNRPDPQGVI